MGMIDMTQILSLLSVLLLGACEALRSAPTMTATSAVSSDSANLTAAVTTWQTNRLQSVATAINNDPGNIPINTALQSIVTYSDTTLNPMATVQSNGRATYEQSIQETVASAVPVPTSIISTLNDTSDIVKSQFTSMDVNFTYEDPVLFNLSVADLGSNYTSYAQPSTQYSILVQ